MTDQRLAREIEHGKKIAHQAGEVWNWETPAGRLRWARRVRMLSSHIEPHMHVLEIGCGTGYLTKELAKTQAQVTAIDISPDLLSVARKQVTDSTVVFRVENAYDLSFRDESFHTIIGSSVLHHLDVDKALAEFYRILKRKGTICFTEPNMMNPQIAIQKNIPYIKGKLGDSPDETAFFKWSLHGRISSHGFKKVHIQTFDFLHPQIPRPVLPFLERICLILETIPLVNEIAGSLYIRGKK
jgi:SAM-dependent methyltransferase